MRQTAGKRRYESEIHAAPRHRQDSRSAAVTQIDMPGEQSGDLNRSGSYKNQFRIDAIFGEKSLFLGDPKWRYRSLYRRIADKSRIDFRKNHFGSNRRTALRAYRSELRRRIGNLACGGSGVDLRFVASFTSRLTHLLITKPEIQKPKDLTGKRIGVVSIGGTQWITTKLGLENLGVDEQRDNIRLLPIGDQTVLEAPSRVAILKRLFSTARSPKNCGRKAFVFSQTCTQRILRLSVPG